jgi:ribosomal protein S18 acetylase RimI-like enzyme
MGSSWNWNKWGASLTPRCEPDEPLDNAVWWTLTSRHRRHATTVGRARRYHRDVSVFSAVDSFDEESWADLAKLLGPSGTGWLFRTSVPATLPAGWNERARGRGRQMTVESDHLRQGEQHQLVQLTTDHVPQMLELVAATDPGPFRSATIELGRYFGHFHGERLVAMAGERLSFDGYTEISAVCTHPAFRGRGLAAALTHAVASGIFERGERPFLHVAESNERARRVYEGLGFTQLRLVDFVVVRSPPT